MPDIQGLREKKILRNISIGYKNGLYVGDTLAPRVIVKKKTDKYHIFGKEKFNVPDDTRARRGRANVVDWELSKDSYYCEEHALDHPIDPEQKSENETIASLEKKGVELTTDGLLMKKDHNVATIVQDVNTYPATNVTTLLASEKFDQSDSKPDEVIDAAKDTCKRKYGIPVNAILVPPPIHNVLKKHPRLQSLLSSNERKILSPKDLAEILGFQQYITPDILMNQMPQGIVSNLDYMFGNNIVLAYIPPRPSKETPAFMYTFMYEGYDANLNFKEGFGTYEWADAGARTTYVGTACQYDIKVVCKEAGFLIKEPISAAKFSS